MDKGRITANLEERIKPIPKEKRIFLKRSKALEKYISDYKEDDNFRYNEWQHIKANTILLYSALIESLSSNENTECIEEMAHYFNSKKRENRIIDNKPFLRRGPEWFDEMSEIVKGMLGIETDRPPVFENRHLVFRHPGKYDADKKEITLHNINPYFVPEVVAHEYIHHAQYAFKYSMSWKYNKVLLEGMAYPLGNASAREYAFESGNLIALRTGSSYLSEGLMQTIKLIKEGERHRKTCMERNVEHYPGIAAFLVAEAKHGKKIYREIIKSPQPAEYLIKKLK
ncbi:MAG: hypothetical protein PHO02_05315 [Candidatus Nanoarchaeia archaeon]|nr:hypothetical protein [Candidatus Nanoarchaeia archaeon]